MKLKSTLTAFVLVTALVSANSFARGPGGGGYHGGGGPAYGDGFFDGLVASTAALFLSETSEEANYKALYQGADIEAATFVLANGAASPSASLVAAMNVERDFEGKAGVVDASTLNDQDLAYLVLKHAELIQQQQ